MGDEESHEIAKRLTVARVALMFLSSGESEDRHYGKGAL
jgi:hypothetical protein